MDKQTVTRYAVILFLGFILGSYLGFNTGKTLNKPAEVPLETVVQEPTQNKLFAFFDTFTQDKDMGGPEIKITYPEAHLILLWYPNSQESAAYAIYNYKDDVLYADIGGDYPAGGTTPYAFIDTDKILAGIYADDNTSSIVIQDFKNTRVKTLLTNTPIIEVYPKYGKQIYIRTGQDDTHSKTYILDTETLELTEQSQPKG